jgi:predicted XRE-type DNA-binding protein
VGSSKKDLRSFPVAVRSEIGQSLFEAQLGEYRRNAKPLKGFSGVLEFATALTVIPPDRLHNAPGGRPARVSEKIHPRICYAARSRRPGPAALARRQGYSQGNKGRPIMSTKKKLPAHDVGSGNIFADLGLPNAEVHQLKAALVVQLKRLMADREMTQIEAAKLVDMRQPDLSKLLRGQFKLVSVEKLLRMLTAFDQDVEITVKPHRKRGEAGRITFIPV